MKWPSRTMRIPGYPEDERRADVRNGRRDGRHQLPTYSEVVELVNADAAVTTPYCTVLITLGRNQIDQEYQAFLRAVDGHLLRRASLRADLVIAEQNERRALDNVTAAEEAVTEDELRPRSVHELTMSPQQLRGRRGSMRERRISLAGQEAARRTALRENCEKEIKETSEMIDKLFAKTQANARKVASHVELRMATYWNALIDRHSEGRNLATILPMATFPLPEWVEALCWVGDVTPAAQEVTP